MPSQYKKLLHLPFYLSILNTANFTHATTFFKDISFTLKKKKHHWFLFCLNFQELIAQPLDLFRLVLNWRPSWVRRDAEGSKVCMGKCIWYEVNVLSLSKCTSSMNYLWILHEYFLTASLDTQTWYKGKWATVENYKDEAEQSNRT